MTMTTIQDPPQPLTPEALEARLRSLAQALPGDAGVDDIEMRHLLEILTRSSLLVGQGYDRRTLDRILASGRQPVSWFDLVPLASKEAKEDRLVRALSVPDVLRTCGDKCLYDVGLAGRRTFRGIDLQALGPRSYALASHVLSLLADDRTLRDFYDHNRMERLPIEEEVLFLRQCAARFQLYAQLLAAIRTDAPPLPAPRAAVSAALERSTAAARLAGTTTARRVPHDPGPPPGARQAPPATAPAAGAEALPEETERLSREERLAGYERTLLFSALDIAGLRRRLKDMVVDQDAAVDQLCDDLAVYALGTRGRPRPQSYLLVGPTGVGKNYLLESLVRCLSATWGIDVPLLVIEGPQYTYPSDVTELKGSTRGFIRSDEEGLLAEFHARAGKAPLSFLLVDEVEKAHPQLARFFLSLMDRGWTLDNKGRILRFPATILAYTSNLGYSEEAALGRPIGYGARPVRSVRAGAASRSIKRGLPPEFLNRLHVIHFAPLSRDSAWRILDQEIGRIAARYRGLHGVELVVTPAARQALVALGFSEEYGARHLMAQVDRVCNVEVSLTLHTAPASLTPEVHRLLERIRAARQGSKAIDEESIRVDVARQTRGRLGPLRVIVDHHDGRFVHRLEPGCPPACSSRP